MQEPLNSHQENTETVKTRGDRKKLKYKEQIAGFNLKDKSTIRDGLVKDRKTTDCGCCILFLAVIGCMVGLAGYGLAKGNVNTLIGGVDGNLRICGSEGLEKYPHLYVTKLESNNLNEIFSTGVCVQKCPAESTSMIDCMPTTQVPNCNSNDVKANEYDTVTIGGYCFPKSVDDLPQAAQEGWNKVIDQFKNSQAGKTLNDLKITKVAVLTCLGMGFVYSTLYIYAMSRFADCMSKLAILVIETSMIGWIGVTFWLRGQPHTTNGEKTAYLWAAIGAGIIFVIFNLLLCCFWKQVKVAIAVIDATADFFAATKRIILVSVLYFFVTLAFILVWFAAVGCIMSLNTITADPSALQGKDIQWKSETTWFLIFMTFGLIWVVFYIQDKTGFICMVSAASYYFTSNENKEGSASVSTGFRYAYFKHSGSLAFGALVHTIVTVIRMIVEQAADNVERGGENVAVKVLACCARCCVRCFEDLVEYLNRIAYAYMAVSGDSYCTSAWNGFMLNLKHLSKFTWGVTLANMFIFMGKVMITCINMVTCFLIMKYITKDTNAVSSVWSPVALIGVSTFVTATIFLSLFDEATLATLHCLAIDMDLNDGKPVYGPPTFHEKISKIYGESGKHHPAQVQQTLYQGPATTTGNINGGNNVNAMV